MVHVWHSCQPGWPCPEMRCQQWLVSVLSAIYQPHSWVKRLCKSSTKEFVFQRFAGDFSNEFMWPFILINTKTGCTGQSLLFCAFIFDGWTDSGCLRSLSGTCCGLYVDMAASKFLVISHMKANLVFFYLDSFKVPPFKNSKSVASIITTGF